MKKISSLARMGIAHRHFGNPIPQVAYDLIEATEKCVEEFNPPTLADFKGHSSLACMVKGHISVWRTAIQLRLETEEDEDNAHAYYEHELKALQDIENAVEQLLKENK